MTKLHKDGDHFGIETDCLNSDNFLREVAGRLNEMIEQGLFKHDWTFHLEGWLPLIMTICDALNGNKSVALKRQITFCGEIE